MVGHSDKIRHLALVAILLVAPAFAAKPKGKKAEILRQQAMQQLREIARKNCGKKNSNPRFCSKAS